MYLYVCTICPFVSHPEPQTLWHSKVDPLTQRECLERFTEIHTHGHTQWCSAGTGSMSSSLHKLETL